jgi:EAL domain-containing protein (putative c-di-GMP-specific phosphodiesterase class I)
MGLVHRLGEWVLRRACAQNAEWQERGFRKIYVSVNVSALQIQRDDFVDLTAAALKDSGLEPHWVKLELTESLLMDGSDFITERLRSLDRLGVHIAIDDFGTGYSSLNYLRRWPIHTLKIDRSFIAESRDNRAGVQIVSAIANMAQALGLNIIAEGVEIPEQLHLIRSVGCQQVQGYLFGKPMSPENFVEGFLRPGRQQLRTDIDKLLDALRLPPKQVNGIHAPKA